MKISNLSIDRVAILSEGKLRCCGTSLFLKNRFGAGYILSITLDDTTTNTTTSLTYTSDVIDNDKDSQAIVVVDGSNNISTSSCTIVQKPRHQIVTEIITTAILNITPSAKVVSEFAGEVIFQLPVETASLLGTCRKYHITDLPYITLYTMTCINSIY